MIEPERRLAHERLSTGGLARWTRFCATHPWRIVFGWIGLIVLLIVTVATVGGSLKDEFTIPGSESQKATDLIKSEFASEQGGVLNLVFAAPKGETLDTPERKQAINAAVAKLKTSEFKATKDHGWHRERRRPVQRRHVLEERGASRTPRRSSTRRSSRRIATRSSPSRMPCAARSSRPA